MTTVIRTKDDETWQRGTITLGGIIRTLNSLSERINREYEITMIRHKSNVKCLEDAEEDYSSLIEDLTSRLKGEFNSIKSRHIKAVDTMYSAFEQKIQELKGMYSVEDFTVTNSIHEPTGIPLKYINFRK